MPASAITLVQRAMSLAISALKSSGVPPLGSLPSAWIFHHGGLGDQRVDLALSRDGDVLRQLGRPDHAHPGRDGESGEAGLGDGADIRQRRVTLVAGDADGMQRAGLDLADQRDRRIDQEVEPLAEQVGQRLVAAAERHDLNLDAGEPHEIFDQADAAAFPRPARRTSSGSERAFAALMRSGMLRIV